MVNSGLDENDKQRLSLLLDGEADAACARDACAAWKNDADARATWHAYHLIGDVLRSDDLAQPVDRDAAFLAALRARLADEPVVLAPQPPAAEARPRRWTMPVAVAAGVAAVAGVLVIVQVRAPDADPALASAPGPVKPTPVAVAVDAQDVPPSVADGKLIRDARLDRYLAAHKRYGDSSAVAVPGVVLRSSATVAPSR